VERALSVDLGPSGEPATTHPLEEREMLKPSQMFVAAAAVALVTAVTAAGAPVLTGPGTIQVTSKLAKQTHVDQGKRGPSAGDVDFYREVIFNKKITPNPIGHSDVSCTSTGTGSMHCNGTFLMPKGKLVVGGVIASRRTYVLAVLGGTGLYDNVRGTLTVSPLGKSANQWAVLFKLGV
jgi:hypothetical protein